jgi:Cof subfamily protein (haloacid dehalogenase superfamily)
MVVSDVDGTLLGPLQRLTPRTFDAVRRTVAAGVPFVLASGRPPRWIPEVAEQAGLAGYAVCANGAVLYHIGDDRVVEVHGTLEPVHLHDIASTLEKALPGCRLAAERVGLRTDTEATVFISEHGYRNPWGDHEVVPGARADVLGHPAIKLLVSVPGMNADEMAVAARTLLGGVVDITYSARTGLIEIAQRGVSKATGVADLAARLDVPAERVVAFGDMPNDLAMLTWAGTSYAVANGHESVLAAADHVAPRNSGRDHRPALRGRRRAGARTLVLTAVLRRSGARRSSPSGRPAR